MVFYLTTEQYNQIQALTDSVGSLGLNWLSFMELYGVSIRPNDFQANLQQQSKYEIHIHIPASEYAQTIPLINNGAAIGGANADAYTSLNYIFGANIANEETVGNPYPFLFVPDFTYEVVEPIPQNVNISAVFSNLVESVSATFALYYVNGTLINTQNVTADANGTAIVTFNTGILSGGTTEIYIQVTQQVSAALAKMRSAINMNKTVFVAVS